MSSSWYLQAVQPLGANTWRCVRPSRHSAEPLRVNAEFVARAVLCCQHGSYSRYQPSSTSMILCPTLCQALQSPSSFFLQKGVDRIRPASGVLSPTDPPPPLLFEGWDFLKQADPPLPSIWAFFTSYVSSHGSDLLLTSVWLFFFHPLKCCRQHHRGALQGK